MIINLAKTVQTELASEDDAYIHQEYRIKRISQDEYSSLAWQHRKDTSDQGDIPIVFERRTVRTVAGVEKPDEWELFDFSGKAAVFLLDRVPTHASDESQHPIHESLKVCVEAIRALEKEKTDLTYWFESEPSTWNKTRLQAKYADEFEAQLKRSRLHKAWKENRANVDKVAAIQERVTSEYRTERDRITARLEAIEKEIAAIRGNFEHEVYQLLAEKPEDLKHRIIEAILDEKEPLLIHHLEAMLDVNRTSLKLALDALLESGELIQLKDCYAIPTTQKEKNRDMDNNTQPELTPIKNTYTPNYEPISSVFSLHSYDSKTNRFGFDYNAKTYTMACDSTTADLKNFKDESGKTIARTYKAMKALLGIQGGSALASEFRQMAMFASNYQKKHGNKSEVIAITSVVSSGNTSGFCTVSRNEEKGGIEVRFKEKPDQGIIDKLKSYGFRWSKFSKCWWVTHSERANAIAQEIASQLNGTDLYTETVQKSELIAPPKSDQPLKLGDVTLEHAHISICTTSYITGVYQHGDKLMGNFTVGIALRGKLGKMGKNQPITAYYRLKSDTVDLYANSNGQRYTATIKGSEYCSFVEGLEVKYFQECVGRPLEALPVTPEIEQLARELIKIDFFEKSGDRAALISKVTGETLEDAIARDREKQRQRQDEKQVLPNNTQTLEVKPNQQQTPLADQEVLATTLNGEQVTSDRCQSTEPETEELQEDAIAQDAAKLEQTLLTDEQAIIEAKADSIDKEANPLDNVNNSLDKPEIVHTPPDLQRFEYPDVVLEVWKTTSPNAYFVTDETGKNIKGNGDRLFYAPTHEQAAVIAYDLWQLERLKTEVEQLRQKNQQLQAEVDRLTPPPTPPSGKPPKWEDSSPSKVVGIQSKREQLAPISEAEQVLIEFVQAQAEVFGDDVQALLKENRALMRNVLAEQKPKQTRKPKTEKLAPVAAKPWGRRKKDKVVEGQMALFSFSDFTQLNLFAV